MTLSRYWHTLRYLKATQIAGRVWRRVYQPAPDLRPAPSVRRTGRWIPFTWRAPSLLGPNTVSFLGVRADIDTPAAWQDTRRDYLWRFNLHYFDDLTAMGAVERRHWHELLMRRWIAENRPGSSVGWAAYPVSLRLVNWIKWLLDEAAPPEPAPVIVDSLAVQARWLSRRFEFQLMGNHLWANAKGLLFAGVYFDGDEAARWRETSLRVLARELREQVLPDGGHFERSPMYHAIVLEDVLDLLQLARLHEGLLPDAFVDSLRTTAFRMSRWLRVMTHPDGDISFFNDAAVGIAAPSAALDAYARDLHVEIDERPLAPIEWLRDSGYVRSTNDRASLFCDVAPVGPDFQPGHAHADTLSFELSVDGRRVLVNGGTSTYEPGHERHRQRGTGAHNTVCVAGVNSSDVWAAFRVGRRARPFDVDAHQTGDELVTTAAHDGYRHLGVIHRRNWRLSPSRLTIVDELHGREVPATARLLLHPSEVERPSVAIEASVALRRVPATWHPGFGGSVETAALEATPVGQMTTVVSWT